MKNLLVIIDPQNDFVDPKGSLYVPGAERAIEEIIKFVKERGDQIDEIFVTQDSHFKFHIGHSCFWNGDPDPFTTITVKDIRSGKYTPKDVENWCWIDAMLGDERCNEGEVIAQIWPEHCIIGTWGHALPENLLQTLHEWALNKHTYQPCLVFIPKGQRSYKEEYSAWDALITVYEDLSFFDDDDSIHPFDGYNKIWISGVAKDVCVANTVEDMCVDKPGCSQVSFLDRCMAALDPNAKSLEIFDEAIKKLGATWEE